MKRKRMKRVMALLLGCVLAAGPCGTLGSLPFGGIEALADSRSATINATNVNIRSGPGTSYQAVARLSMGAAVTVVSETAGSDGRTWYEIRYSGSAGEATGYVSSQYVKFPSAVATDGNFETYLNSQGFPDSYKQSLRELHAQYPNWTFTAFHTNLDWNTAVENECVIGRNLVGRENISSWKSTADGAYDWDTGTWPGFDGNAWVQASEDIICYYMDPRNFLNEKYIFQFMKQTYDASLHTREGLVSMVSGTFLAGTASSSGTSQISSGGSTSSSGGSTGPASSATGPGSVIISPSGTTEETAAQTEDSGVTISPVSPTSGSEEPIIVQANGAISPGMVTGPGSSTDSSGTIISSPGDSTSSTGSTGGILSGSTSYVDIIMSAASQSGVSPYILASMILQEQGSQGTGRTMSGTVSGYQGYYNFFNIEAYQSGSMSAVERGLWWASQSGTYGRPWNTVEGAIVGGALWYGDNYVKKGQDTLYLKKFNVQGDNLYKHQYMTNVLAAAAEGLTLAKITSLQTAALEFSIPVYNNMPATACVKPALDGSPNNKLSALGVQGFALTPTFARDTESYDLIVDQSVASVVVEASAIDSAALVSGTGTVDLQSGINEITVSVTAENGSIRNYVLHVVRQAGGPVYSDSIGSGVGTTGSSGSSGSSYGPGGSTSGPGSSDSSTTGGGSDVVILPSTGTASGTDTSSTDGTVISPAAPGTGVSGFGSETNSSSLSGPQGSVFPGAVTVTAAAGGGTVSPSALPVSSGAQTPERAGVPGDVNGDGKFGVLDLLSTQRHILGLETLTGTAAAAADVNGNGKIDILDILIMQKDILGIEKMSV